MALFMKKFQKYVKKKKFSKGENKFKPKTKRTCYNYDKHGYFIANCPFERRDENDKKRNTSPTRRTRTTREVTSPTRRSPMVKLTFDKNETPMMRAPTPIMTMWQLWLSRKSLLQASLSSQSSIKETYLSYGKGRQTQGKN
jgi:hypothetical protein